MKAIILLFDSLNKRYLPPYGCQSVTAPGFKRLEEKCTVFDSCYVSSMPCIPARRDMHTGRPHFLHREWGPLEPYDVSVFSLLKEKGVYSHLITDHYNYWEEGGGGYHTKYNSFEFIRGQEGDRCCGDAGEPVIPPVLREVRSHSQNAVSGSWKANWKNRRRLDEKKPETYPLFQVFERGEAFIRENAHKDQWVLQIESFSPHEPFLVPGQFRDMYMDDYDGPVYDWPRGAVEDFEDDKVISHMRTLYKASISACDACLSRILDMMDALDMWKDTLLMVCADHGILLGEHGYWSKNIMPYYDEIANIPLFIHAPGLDCERQRRTGLVQTIDWAPTLLDFFGLDIPPVMTGVSLLPAVAQDTPVRDCGLFGVFSGHVNLVDEDYIYMRAAQPGREDRIFNYTLLPLHMFTPFTPKELSGAMLAEPMAHTMGCPLLKIPSRDIYHVAKFGNLLFDRKNDVTQEYPLNAPEIEQRLCRKMVRLMRACDAPPEQFERLGLEGWLEL